MGTRALGLVPHWDFCTFCVVLQPINLKLSYVSGLGYIFTSVHVGFFKLKQQPAVFLPYNEREKKISLFTVLWWGQCHPYHWHSAPCWPDRGPYAAIFQAPCWACPSSPLLLLPPSTTPSFFCLWFLCQREHLPFSLRSVAVLVRCVLATRHLK